MVMTCCERGQRGHPVVETLQRYYAATGKLVPDLLGQPFRQHRHHGEDLAGALGDFRKSTHCGSPHMVLIHIGTGKVDKQRRHLVLARYHRGETIFQRILIGHG